MKKQHEAMFTSVRDDWETPDDLFEQLDKEFHFTIDVASNDQNTKCERHYTKEDDGLSKSWKNEIVWCNPPYGRIIDKWVKKAYEETFNNTTTVMLLPSRTSNRWFHEYALPYAEIRFIKGRLKFKKDGVPDGASPFPSVIIIFRGKQNEIQDDEILRRYYFLDSDCCHDNS